MFPALMKNLGGRKYKDDGDVETTLTRLLITKYTDRYKKKKISSSRYGINVPFVVGTTWKSNGMVV